jgi:hypothetical protein
VPVALYCAPRTPMGDVILQWTPLQARSCSAGGYLWVCRNRSQEAGSSLWRLV